MPRSQTPVVSCALAGIAPRIAAFRSLHTVGVDLDITAAILMTTTLPIAGRNDAACLLVPSSFVRPLLGGHVAFPPALLARRWSGGICLFRRTHWVTSTHCMRSLSIPRFRAYLGASKRLLGSESVPDTFSAPDFNAHAMHWLPCSGGIGCCATHVGRAHSFWLATRAPSARAPSFAQAIVGTTVSASAKVAKPQSTPATTFSRPTSSA